MTKKVFKRIVGFATGMIGLVLWIAGVEMLAAQFGAVTAGVVAILGVLGVLYPEVSV